ncbi:sigma-70 family RNA polymerase sigma factor [Kitasatospora herbaricolor]|uniref:sigma-70 family RNA polymerase sigma factor n=1 Tax=Kitasatospora herbaricolor TaxID=68217 RepID=UPI0036D9EC5E
MDHQVTNLKAALGRLYVGLQAKQVRGVVPYQVFRSETEALGLSEEERTRLADALNAMKLRIGEPAPSKAPQRPAREPVQKPAASERLATARRLLGRFADDRGKVSARAVHGVVRLAGLSVQEADELRAGVTVALPAARSATESPSTRTAPVGAAPPVPAQAAPASAASLAKAVAAARAVMAGDRFTLRPAKRILTAEEECGLGLLLRGGAQRAGTEPTDEELAGLLPGDERRRARDCLVVHNQGLAHSLVRQFAGQGLEYEDLAQHGMLGLMRAARKFDPLMGTKFSTYATQWVRQTIGRAIADEGSIIRIPVHMHELMQKVARTERTRLSQGLQVRAADLAVACDLRMQKVEEIRRLSRRTDSLDRIIGDGVHLGDLIEARTAIPGVERTVIAAMSEADMHAAVAALPERYSHIVTRRYGLDGQAPATLEEIGQDLGVTRERVRQLEVKVLPLLQLAFSDPAGAPYLTLRRMLTDEHVATASSNPVQAILKDLASRDWKAGVGALQTFRRREGARPPSPDHMEGSFPLGQWIDEQRELAGVNGARLPTHRRIVLESLGMEWAPEPDRGSAKGQPRSKPHLRPSRPRPPRPVGAPAAPRSGPDQGAAPDQEHPLPGRPDRLAPQPPGHNTQLLLPLEFPV